MNNWLIGAIFFFLPFSIQGKTTVKFTGDTLHYLIPQDTIFLTSGLYAQKIFTHVMTPKQTLYSLSKFYGLTLDEIYFYNPKNDGGKYSPGSRIKIPIPNRCISRYKPKDYHPTLYVPVYYMVQKGETLFNVAHRVFKLPIDTIMDRNNLNDVTLSVGQALHVGWMSIKGIPNHLRQFKGHPLWQKSYTFKRKYIVERRKKKEYARKGAAVYIKGAKSGSDLFVMHRYAPVGSVIQVNNPMKKRTIYARVVAKTPETYAANIELVVSPKVGEMLGAIDQKFYVRTKYLR